MSASGESRSVFVVQRHFRRVMRGYDPDEVDRHLQLVSEGSGGSRVGEMTRGIEDELAAREEAVSRREREAERALEGARVEAEATLAGARLKAGAIVDRAEQEAAASAIVREAEQEVRAYVERRRREADRLVDAARRERRQAGGD